MDYTRAENELQGKRSELYLSDSIVHVKHTWFNWICSICHWF